ncbi:MAG TPA: hypothetical protein VL614_00655 [Acetobacteraceae bacterium]|jgi:hypothetical protein|nr:hypothetical protein [Acetobacteraceae bacterium]
MGRARDHELYDIRRIMAILQAMPVPQRRRVLQYVNDRVDMLPPFMPPKPPGGAQEETDLLRETA